MALATRFITGGAVRGAEMMLSKFFLFTFLAFAAPSPSDAIWAVPSAVSGAPGLAKAAAAAAAAAAADAAPGGGRILRLRGGHHEGYTLGVRDSIMIAHSFLVWSQTPCSLDVQSQYAVPEAEEGQNHRQ